MTSLRTVSPWAPLAAFAFAVAHVGFEYFNGGVKTHHFLARADLPGFSNWLGLLILPLLGVVLAVRARSAQGGPPASILQPTVAAGTVASLLYGGVLAASFLLGLGQASSILFTGLFVCAIAFPVYRAEYIFGFVVAMTIAFGSVIPLTVAGVFATISFVLRRAAVFVLAARK